MSRAKASTRGWYPTGAPARDGRGIVHRMRTRQRPLLVFGPGSASYDFGAGHPLTPRRFGPGIDLLRAVGAVPGLLPEPATDDELLAVHDARFVRLVRRFSGAPSGPPEAGIGPGDVPPFAGMHEAGAMVAGGSLRAMEAILRGEVGHAFHPGGGLHHAMPARASGFCIYNDPSLAIARARAAGLRVLYLDFDVHHGDGVETIHRLDPGVMTFSIHESGRSLFPGTGFVEERDDDPAGGTVVNIPLEAGTGAGPWLAAVERLVPELAAAFGPDVVVSQHGCDAHAWDPLAHLRVTTTAMGRAARLTDEIAHRHAAGRWLATGGGGYDAYRVVPRAWALVWLAAAHDEVPPAVPGAWRERWAAEAVRYGQAPLPDRFEDAPEVGLTDGRSDGGERRVADTVDLVRRIAVPALIRHAVDAGWWFPATSSGAADPGDAQGPAGPPQAPPHVLPEVDPGTWRRLRLAARVAGPADPGAGHALLAGALGSRDGVLVSAAVAGAAVVGVAVSAWDQVDQVRRILALGVAPDQRRKGLGRALLVAHLDAVGARREAGAIEMLVTAAERDIVAPLARADRARIARRLLEGTGFAVSRPSGPVGRADPAAIVAVRPARG